MIWFLVAHFGERRFFFFFSSRRRHTRSKRDWSSDVCSSDLVHQALGVIGVVGEPERMPQLVGHRVLHVEADCVRVRSEERRVGKECRSWGSTDEEKKRE